MKKTLLLSMVIMLLMSTLVFSQVTIYGSAGVGTMMSEGSKPSLAKFTSVNTPLYTDTVKGISNYLRATYYSVNDDDFNEYQGGALWDITQKTLGILSDAKWYGAIGFGGLDDPVEKLKLGFKIETGLNIKGDFGVALGADFIPLTGKKDRSLVYVRFEIVP